jgi:hypothetical protein
VSEDARAAPAGAKAAEGAARPKMAGDKKPNWITHLIQKRDASDNLIIKGEDLCQV